MAALEYPVNQIVGVVTVAVDEVIYLIFTWTKE